MPQALKRKLPVVSVESGNGHGKANGNGNGHEHAAGKTNGDGRATEETTQQAGPQAHQGARDRLRLLLSQTLSGQGRDWPGSLP
jgi:hypothetical protein